MSSSCKCLHLDVSSEYASSMTQGCVTNCFHYVNFWHIQTR